MVVALAQTLVKEHTRLSPFPSCSDRHKTSRQALVAGFKTPSLR